MKISYKPLWKILNDKKWSKCELMRKADLTTNQLAKMGKDQHISMSSVVKICVAANCGLADVFVLVHDDEK